MAQSQENIIFGWATSSSNKGIYLPVRQEKFSPSNMPCCGRWAFQASVMGIITRVICSQGLQVGRREGARGKKKQESRQLFHVSEASSCSKRASLPYDRPLSHLKYIISDEKMLVNMVPTVWNAECLRYFSTSWIKSHTLVWLSGRHPHSLCHLYFSLSCK